MTILYESAIKMLKSEIAADKFKCEEFEFTDIIAIDKKLALRLKKYFL